MLLAVTPADDVSEWASAIGGALTEALGNRKQRWLAKQMGVDPATVSRLLSGKGSPTLDQIDRAAAALGVTRRRLLARAGYLSDNDLVDLDVLPDDVRKMVELILREFQGVPAEGSHAAKAVDEDLHDRT